MVKSAIRKKRNLKNAKRIPKGHQGGGRFAKKGQTAPLLAQAATRNIKLRPAGRLFEGKLVTLPNVYRDVKGGGKWIPAYTGKIGEALAVDYLKRRYGRVAKSAGAAIGTTRNNYAVDLITKNAVIEVKTGMINNSKSAWKWRASVGEISKAEKAFIRTLSPAQKKKWHAQKLGQVLQRKRRAVEELSRRKGRKYEQRTLTMIINPKTRHVDFYEYKGYHEHIRWNNAQGKRGYAGSYKW
jgi:hypothetical protein